MKTKATFLTCVCALALAGTTLGQTPTFPPDASPAPETTFSPAAATAAPRVAATAATPVPAATLAPTATVAPSVIPSPSPDTEEDFDRAIERKINRHLNSAFTGGDSGDEVSWIAIPIVLIVFLSIFGLPVAVVGIILYFSFSKSRALHKTVRMMVEKGQPVPEALLNPPPVVRQRSDLRRGVVLLMIGLGLIVFFGAVNDWEGGAWSLGMIPFLIGAGYLLVWRLDMHRDEDPSPKV